MKKIVVVLACIFTLTSVQFSFAQDYMVGEGDLLRITIYDNPDLSTSVRIGGEGTILFPLIGQVYVAGLSIPQVAHKVEHLLADGYIISPQVTVSIEEFRSQKATVMGQANKPGLYELKGATTFLQLLSNAGGLTKDAGNKAVIRRKAVSGGGEEKIIVIDMKQLIESGNVSYDIPIMDGDSINISNAGYFYVNGQVKKPDSYKFDEGLTLLKAITMAGGFTEWAGEGRVRIIRHIDGKEIVLTKVKLNDYICVDDVIVVPASLF